MEGAPDSSIEHEGSLGDARCVLDHHPDPCDYMDKKGKKCEEYGEFDPDYQPNEDDPGAVGKDTIAAPPAKPIDTRQDIVRLTAKNNKMEVHLGQVEKSVDHLSSEMATQW